MWRKGEVADSWQAGRGIKRKSVIGKCGNYLGENKTHVMRFPRIKTILGIEYKTGDQYAAGVFDVFDGELEFLPLSPATKNEFDGCWKNLESNDTTGTNEEEEDYIENDVFYTDAFTQFISSDSNKNLIIAAISVIVITAFVTIVMRK
mgnify:CR=1 FL=1